MTIQPTPSELEAADAIEDYLCQSVDFMPRDREHIAAIIAAHRGSATAHAAELEAMLRRIMPHIYERGMTGETDWERLVLETRALLVTLERERKTQ